MAQVAGCSVLGKKERKEGEKRKEGRKEVWFLIFVPRRQTFSFVVVFVPIFFSVIYYIHFLNIERFLNESLCWVWMFMWGVVQEDTKMNQIFYTQNAYHLKEEFISQLLICCAFVTNDLQVSAGQQRFILTYAHIT